MMTLDPCFTTPGTVTLLCICDPRDYPEHVAETPEMYRALSLDPRIELLHADPSWITGDSFSVPAVKVPAGISYEGFLELSRETPCEVLADQVDLAFCRTLKPFPADYMERLVQLEQTVRFVNSPEGITRHLEPDFLPSIGGDLVEDILVTHDVAAAVAECEARGAVVAKRAGSCGGKGVYKVWAENGVARTDNLVEGTATYDSLTEAFAAIFATHDEDFQIVPFRKNILEGDKRVLVVDGVILGGYLRKAADGGWVHNVSSGGGYYPAAVSPAEVEAIRRTAAAYQEIGVHTLGYDFLMGDDGQWVISEINAGNIAGYSLLEELTGEPVYESFLLWLISYATQTDAAQTDAALAAM